MANNNNKAELPYGKVVFNIPASRTVQIPKFGNRGPSVTMLECEVPVIGTGLHIKAAIYANLDRSGDGTASVVPNAYFDTKRIIPRVEGAKDLLLAHIENAALKFHGYNEAYDECAAQLLNFADGKSTVTGKVERPKMGRVEPVAAGRLVKPAKAAQSGATTTTGDTAGNAV